MEFSYVQKLSSTLILFNKGLLLLRFFGRCMVFKMIGIHYLKCRMMGIHGLLQIAGFCLQDPSWSSQCFPGTDSREYTPFPIFHVRMHILQMMFDHQCTKCFMVISTCFFLTFLVRYFFIIFEVKKIQFFVQHDQCIRINLFKLI